MRLLVIPFLIISVVAAGMAQNISLSGGGDVLNEAPIYELPDGMTFEEYRDANRRISVGLLLMSVPVPGMLHFYADDNTKGWFCVGAAGLGLTSIIVGTLLRDDSKWPDSDYEIVNIEGNRYEKIPFMIEGEQVDYKLNRLKKKEEIQGGGIVLIAVGGALILGEIVYDWLDGINTIEYKRDFVRYKYGIAEREASIIPYIGDDRTIGLSLAVE